MTNSDSSKGEVTFACIIKLGSEKNINLYFYLNKYQCIVYKMD